MENKELTHHGVRGMKWGVRRYQNKDGSLTKAGKRRLEKQEKAAEEERKKAKEAKAEYNRQKMAALKTGSVADVLKFKGDLTKAQMNKVLERVKWEDDMKKYTHEEISDGKAKADKIFKKIGDITVYSETVLKAYNTVANVYNAFNTDKAMMPKVDTNVTNGNRAQRKKEKEKENEKDKNDDQVSK